ncbi:MAG: hypothetical protein H6807_14255 [Planctomycetes bacterium]|nr:hypothetical protein [Planctomycetota bacterium]
MTADDRSFIESHLERFVAGHEKLDPEAISDYIKANPECHDQVAEFFRLIEVPESGYLQETLDDLTENIYNLAKALIKESPEENRADHENIRFLEQPEAAEHYVAEGDEIVADVQDYAGDDEVRGESMDGLRDCMRRSRSEFDLVMVLLRRAIDLEGRWSADCSNLMGILHLSHENLDEGEACFRAVIGLRAPDLYLRTVQVHAMNNLAYVCAMKAKLDEAILWATRARVLAEECGVEAFGTRFGLMYFFLSRKHDGDLERAAAEIEAMLADPGSQAEFLRCLKLPSNKEILELVIGNGMDRRFSVIRKD